MKFIADVMLGRLAKRLRLLGYDVLYDPALDDNGLIRLSLEQHRLILTRDEALAARPLAANHLFINSDLVEEQLEQVLSAVSRRRVSPHPLLPVQRTARVPAASRRRGTSFRPMCSKTTKRFSGARSCGRIYWRGTHVLRMTEWAGEKKEIAGPRVTDRPSGECVPASPEMVLVTKLRVQPSFAMTGAAINKHAAA